MNGRTVRVAIAEDNDEFRLTVRDIIAYEPDMAVVALWKNGREVLERIEEVKPDVLLLDVKMPLMSGVETIRHLSGRRCDTKIIMLTMHDDEEIVLESFHQGATSFLIKDGPMMSVVRAVREVSQGRGMVDPQVTPILLNQITHVQRLDESWKEILTPREFDVLAQLAGGKSNHQIASALHITVKTAKNHVSHIIQKLGVTDRSQAALYAVRRHWVRL